MHPPEVKAHALELIEQGINDCEISRRIGVPRGTIRDWRRPTYVKYPRIIADACDLLERCFPYNAVDRVNSIGCLHVSLYCSHLVCLLPQHGAREEA